MDRGTREGLSGEATLQMRRGDGCPGRGTVNAKP